MSIIAKIKQILGIGTVKVKLSVPGTFTTNDSEIKGSVEITAKSDQALDHIEIKLEEEHTTGRGDDKKTKTYELGTVKLPGFDMKSGEVKTLEFSLPFSYSKSNNESLSEQGGVLGGLGKLGSMATGEKSAFQVVATADVKGATFDPNDIVEIKRVK